MRLRGTPAARKSWAVGAVVLGMTEAGRGVLRVGQWLEKDSHAASRRGGASSLTLKSDDDLSRDPMLLNPP